MKKIKYYVEGIGMPDLKPAKSYIPDWYKSIKGLDKNNIQFQNNLVKSNFKSCMPFLDTFTSGYILELWTDVFVTSANGFTSFNWSAGPAPIEARDSSVFLNNQNPISIPAGHTEEQFAWKLPLNISIEKGYSILMTHPLNRFELPFTTLSGIIDLDTTPFHNGNIPFFIRKNFQGMIPKGTPILQVLPFKRESWESSPDISLKEKLSVHKETRARTMIDWYKKNHWQKKEYN